MAIKTIEAVLELCVGSSTDKLVLLVLANYAREDGCCWPSLTVLSEKTELTSRAIKTSLKRLKAAGFIEVIHRHRHSSLFKVNVVPPKGNVVPLLGERGSTLGEGRSPRTVKDPLLEPSRIRQSERPLETVAEKDRSQRSLRLLSDILRRNRS